MLIKTVSLVKDCGRRNDLMDIGVTVFLDRTDPRGSPNPNCEFV